MTANWRRWTLALLLLSLLGVRCSLLDGAETTPPADEPSVVATVTVAPTPETAAVSTSPFPPAATAQLRVWLVAAVSNRIEAPGGAILDEQLQAFAANHPGLELDVEVKSPAGPGGTLNYLRSGLAVAPSALPDLIVLPAEELATAAAEELIYPLDDYLAEELWDDLFPAGDSLSTVGDVHYGFPISLNGLEHIIYNTDAITQTLPVTWNEFLAMDRASLAIAGAGNAGIELALQLYLDHGGRLQDALGQTMLDESILALAFGDITRARLEGRLPAATSTATSEVETWSLYRGRSTNMVVTNAAQVFTSLDDDFNSAFGQIPGVDGPLSPLVRGWIWSISATDPARQALAAELISWLSAGPNVGAWSLAAMVLPARRAAFEQWSSADDYAVFLQAELERAAPLPFRQDGPLLMALDAAVLDIFALARSPQSAAAEAVALLQP